MTYIGIDTSNYTTSIAVYDGESVIQRKKLLSVKPGERGLRQSDALFQHTVNLPELIDDLAITESVNAVSVSTRPRNIDGSYMPCFLAGASFASAASFASNSRLYKTSHQVGHILAGLYSANRLDLINNQFIAFHISGGTTDALLVNPDADELIRAELVASSTDLKAGQAVDRAGVLMGLQFPCGKELDKMSLRSHKDYKIKPSMIGMNCSLSGAENKVKKMLDNGEDHCDVAKFVLTYISATLEEMTRRLINEFGNLPILFVGGVMSNTLIKSNITNKFDNVYFAEPEFSCDNATGIAIYGYLKDKYECNNRITS